MSCGNVAAISGEGKRPVPAYITVTVSPTQALEQTVTVIPPPHSPPAPDAGQQAVAPGGRLPWRAAGIGLTSLGTPIGIGVADPALGSIAFVIELAVTLTIIGTALFGSRALSDRAFRLLRWIANRPEPRRLARPTPFRTLSNAARSPTWPCCLGATPAPASSRHPYPRFHFA